MTELFTFLTTGVIAKKLDVERERVSYAVRKLHIEPLGMAGPARILPADSLGKVKRFLARNVKKG